MGDRQLEARPEQSLRRPLASAVHQAVRELGPGGGAGDHALGVVKAFAQREPAGGSGRGAAKLRDRWNPGISVPAARVGRTRATSRSTLSAAVRPRGMAGDTGRGIAVFIDEMQDLGPDDVSALCAACHEISQSRPPVIVVGAGLPHLPAVLSASKSYPERLFRHPPSTG